MNKQLIKDCKKYGIPAKIFSGKPTTKEINSLVACIGLTYPVKWSTLARKSGIKFDDVLSEVLKKKYPNALQHFVSTDDQLEIRVHYDGEPGSTAKLVESQVAELIEKTCKEIMLKIAVGK